jgi:hypothetical protein
MSGSDRKSFAPSDMRGTATRRFTAGDEMVECGGRLHPWKFPYDEFGACDSLSGTACTAAANIVSIVRSIS